MNSLADVFDCCGFWRKNRRLAASMLQPYDSTPSVPLNAQPNTHLMDSPWLQKSPAQTRNRKPKSQPKSEEQWNACREIFYELYVVNDLPLAQVRREMEERHGFLAS